MKWPDGRVFEGKFNGGNPITGKLHFGKTEYEGEVNLAGKPEGQGKMSEDGVIYEGGFLNGKKHKKGTSTTPDGKQK